MILTKASPWTLGKYRTDLVSAKLQISYCVPKLTVRLEVKKRGQKAAIWKAGIWISKLIKEGVNKCLHLDKKFIEILVKFKVDKNIARSSALI